MAYHKGKEIRFCLYCKTRHPLVAKRDCQERFMETEGLNNSSIDWKVYRLNKNKVKCRNKRSPLVDGPILQKKSKRTKRQSPLRSQPGKCPICLSFKGHMLTLGCNHTICQDCYSQVVDSSTLKNTCGLCRSEMFNSSEKQYLLVKDDMDHPFPTCRNKSAKRDRSYLLVNLDELNIT